MNISNSKGALPIIFLHNFSEIHFFILQLSSQDYLFILSHHSSLINLEQSMIFVSCELLSLEEKINHFDTCSRIHSTQKFYSYACLIFRIVEHKKSGYYPCGPGLLETRESLREDCSLSVLRFWFLSITLKQ